MKLVKTLKKDKYTLIHEINDDIFPKDCISVYDESGNTVMVNPKIKAINYNRGESISFLNSYNDEDYNEMLQNGIEVIKRHTK